MVSTDNIFTEQVESLEELTPTGPKGEAHVKRWLTEIDLAKKDHKRFHEQGKKIIDIYKDSGTETNEFEFDQSHVRYNTFWSTIQTIKPALYARTPKPVVERRHKKDDPVARLTSSLLERSLRYTLNSYDFDYVMDSVVEDFLLPGRGVAWVRYVPHYGKTETRQIRLASEGEAPEGTEILEDEQGLYFTEQYQPVEYEEVVTDYIHWRDFFHSPARLWSDVRWIAKRVQMSKGDVKKRFGKEIANQINYSNDDEGEDGYLTDEDITKKELFKKVTVYEIWNKGDKKVYWISPGYKKGPLDIKKDPLRLKKFFPCPRPITATTTTDSCIPIADVSMYSDIINELDKISKRISLITEAIKITGVYNPECGDFEGILHADENTFKPAENWHELAQAGGLKGVMDFVPIKEWAEALALLNEQKNRLLEDYYLLSGFSDIIRGSANPHETATAQQIKGRFATLRLGSSQQDIQRFAKDLVALMGEIIAEHFSPETIQLASGFTPKDDQEAMFFEQALELLKNDPLRRFRIIIETDSTIAINEDVEKEERIEFLNMMGNFFGQAIGISEQTPEFMQTAMEGLKFGVRAFRAGRPLEQSIENGIKEYILRKQEEANQPPPPDPEIVKLQQKMQIEQQKIQSGEQVKMSQIQADYQQKMIEFQQKFQLKSQDLQAEYQLQQQKQMAELQKEREKLSLMAEKNRGELQLQVEKIKQDMQIELAKIRQTYQTELQRMHLKAGVDLQEANIKANVERGKGSAKRVRKIKASPDGGKEVTVEESAGG